jgi:hypothetical protein
MGRHRIGWKQTSMLVKVANLHHPWQWCAQHEDMIVSFGQLKKCQKNLSIPAFLASFLPRFHLSESSPLAAWAKS